jgi:uncharacterized protein involved in tolerance to divalent cations
MACTDVFPHVASMHWSNDMIGARLAARAETEIMMKAQNLHIASFVVNQS